MPGTHALLSPSAAHRWLHCTAAPRLEQREEDQGSVYAEEGTLAHAYCAKKLKSFLGLPVEEEETEITALGEHRTGEMDEYTDNYAALVIGKYEDARQRTSDARLLVETKLDLTAFIPECSGTADATIIADGTMEVIDFKYGKGVKVEAVENPQMMIYALGAWAAFNFEYRIEKVRMTIVQPRIDSVSEWELSVAELLEWTNKTLKPKAEEAYSGDSHTMPGEWCRFCKVRSRCKALATNAEKLTGKGDPRLLSEKELAEILPKLDTIRTWLSAVEEYTLQQALQGVTYSGYKLVAGRSIRRISDQEAVIKVLSAEYQPEDFMRPRELKTITDLERLTGKKRLAELCGQYIVKPEGKPTLVPESDKRPALNDVRELADF